MAKAVIMAVLAKLGYKKGEIQQHLSYPQPAIDISTI